MFDGVPHGLLLIYFFGEIALGILGLYFLFKQDPASPTKDFPCERTRCM